jgi:hypothetical protein
MLSSSSSFILRRLSGPRSRPTAIQNLKAAEIVLGTSWSATRNSDQYTTEAVRSPTTKYFTNGAIF